MAKVNAGTSELRRAFLQHSSVTGNNPSNYLLTFYAVECGLKSIICSPQRNGHRSGQLSALQQTHDLATLLKSLKFPKVGDGIPVLKLQRDGTAVHVSESHQCWRYGVSLEQSSEQKFIKWLKDLQSQIKTRI